MSPGRPSPPATGPRAALRVGLTGGIASGKSAAAEVFEELGIAVIDTDVIARELVEPGSPVLAELVRAFGNDLLDERGRLRRRWLRERVFADPHQRRRLDAILHPQIRQRALELAAAAPGPYVVLVVPLLIEAGFDRLVDRIVVVDVPEPVQQRRLIDRDGSTEEQARRALAAQAGREARLRVADHVVDNSGTLRELHEQIHALHERLLEEANTPTR